MEELIKQMGNKFRGVWRAKPMTKDGKIMPHEWYVTFEFRGDMQDTFGMPTMKEAFQSAIESLKFE